MAGPDASNILGGIIKLITEEFEELFKDYLVYLQEHEDESSEVIGQAE